MRRWIKVYRAVVGLSAIGTDLLIRLIIAQTFFRSGFLKLMDWDKAVLLASIEYPVPWMAPELAAGFGLVIETLGPLLLLFGLFTRPAAFAMMVLLAVSQIYYLPTTSNLFLIAMLGWYSLHGASSASFDRLFARGLSDSALPLARVTASLFAFLRQRIAPLWMTAVRLWLAATLFAVAGLYEPSIALATWLPLTSLDIIPPMLAIAFGIALIIGFFTTGVVILILLTGLGSAIAGVSPDIVLFPVLLLALYDMYGPGSLSVDRALERWLEGNVLFDDNPEQIPESWPHIVIVGAGFGGLAAANKLKHLPVRVTLLDKRNYHLFQPLLYQIATATLSPSDIAATIRSMFREDGNVTVMKSVVSGVDTEQKMVKLADGPHLAFDKLVIATGARHSYFGRDDWAEFAPGLKTVEDGVSVRGSVLNAFEQAELSDDPEEIRRLLNFVIVGAGPTGVELAGAIAELSRETVAREFRNFDPAMARVMLVQSGPRVLPTFSEDLSAKAEASLIELGVEVRTGSRVTQVAMDHIEIGDERIETQTVLWAAGVRASPAAAWLGSEAGHAGKVIVDEHLRLPGNPDLFIIGDTASSNAWDGAAVPGLAPAAKQAGAHVARVVEAELLRKPLPKEFRYRHQGSLATIGRRSAVADFGRFHVSGALAWWFWGLVHIGLLSGFRSRASVLLSWLWNYFAFHSSARLITDYYVEKDAE